VLTHPPSQTECSSLTEIRNRCRSQSTVQRNSNDFSLYTISNFRHKACRAQVQRISQKKENSPAFDLNSARCIVQHERRVDVPLILVMHHTHQGHLHMPKDKTQSTFTPWFVHALPRKLKSLPIHQLLNTRNNDTKHVATRQYV
jgi:hypothetical protein